MKVKIITGFRDDQHYSIDAEEAHKAYYLFLNPEKRGVFNNGVALVGKNIQGIEPDYHATMGWNYSHKLDSDDWNELRDKGVDRKLQNLLATAKQLAYLGESEPGLMSLPMSEAQKMLPAQSVEMNKLTISVVDKFRLK
jgi:hypothetical protein